MSLFQKNIDFLFRREVTNFIATRQNVVIWTADTTLDLSKRIFEHVSVRMLYLLKYLNNSKAKFANQ